MSEPKSGQGPLATASAYMVEVRAADWEGMCAFYGGTLGLPRRMRDESGLFAMYGSKEPYVAVVGRGPPGAGESRVVIDFVVDDLERVLRALGERGVTPDSGPTASPEGYRIARIVDPEGNAIHLFEWKASAP